MWCTGTRVSVSECAGGSRDKGQLGLLAVFFPLQLRTYKGEIAHEKSRKKGEGEGFDSAVGFTQHSALVQIL